jgi:hypothetical protein
MDMENGDLRLFSAKRQTEMANFCLLVADRNGKWKFVFLGRIAVTANCPSMSV